MEFLSNFSPIGAEPVLFNAVMENLWHKEQQGADKIA